MAFSSLEKRQGAFQHELFEVRCLLVIEKRLLVRILLVKQKFIWIVVRAINDELQVARLLSGRRGKFAQNRFDFFGLASWVRWAAKSSSLTQPSK